MLPSNARLARDSSTAVPRDGADEDDDGEKGELKLRRCRRTDVACEEMNSISSLGFSFSAHPPRMLGRRERYSYLPPHLARVAQLLQHTARGPLRRADLAARRQLDAVELVLEQLPFRESSDDRWRRSASRWPLAVRLQPTDALRSIADCFSAPLGAALLALVHLLLLLRATALLFVLQHYDELTTALCLN